MAATISCDWFNEFVKTDNASLYTSSQILLECYLHCIFSGLLNFFYVPLKYMSTDVETNSYLFILIQIHKNSPVIILNLNTHENDI